MILLISPSLLVYLAAHASHDPRAFRIANGLLPAFLGLLCLCGAYRIMKTYNLAFWSPLPWFLATWALYYGLGPLIYLYGTEESIAHMDTTYPVTDMALLKTNILNVVGLLSVLAGAVIPLAFMSRPTTPRIYPTTHDPWRVAMLFLAMGVPVKYMFELPYVLRLVDYVLPGSIQSFGYFTGLAIIPLSVARAQRVRGASTLLSMLILSEVCVGLVMMSKLQVIMTILLALIGDYAARPDLKRVIVGGLFLVLTYAAVLSPLVLFARMWLARTSAQGVSDAQSAIVAYLGQGKDTLSAALPGVQSWWTRLCYASIQTFGMEQYERGHRGWTLEMAPYILVPRILYPEKPIMTPGFEFTHEIQPGTAADTSTGIGIFGEAYWNGGWWLVLITSLFVGGLFVLFGHISSEIIVARRWLLVPIVFHGILLGLRPDDWFVPTFLGGSMQAVLVGMLLNLAFSRLVKKGAAVGARATGQVAMRPGAHMTAWPR